jgi:hypothetical protein
MMSIRKCMLFLSAWIGLVVLFGAAQPGREARALKVEVPIRVDGVLDEDVWSRAPILSNFIPIAVVQGCLLITFKNDAFYGGKVHL